MGNYQCVYFNGLPFIRLSKERSVADRFGGMPNIFVNEEGEKFTQLEVGSHIVWTGKHQISEFVVDGFRGGRAVVREKLLRA